MNTILERRRFSMNAVQPTSTYRVRVMWLAVGLALLAAVSYILIQLGILGVGDLQTSEGPAAIVYVAAGSYLVGGLLILVRRRWFPSTAVFALWAVIIDLVWWAAAGAVILLDRGWWTAQKPHRGTMVEIGHAA